MDRLKLIAALALGILSTLVAADEGVELKIEHEKLIDSVFIERGQGNSVSVTEFGLQTRELEAWNSYFGHVGLSMLARIGDWQALGEHSFVTQVWDISLTPVLRLNSQHLKIISPFFEIGLGVHAISHVHINDRNLSTGFQFGEILGAGVTFGHHHAFDAGVRLSHVSNCSIKKPNSGLTYSSIVVGYHF